MPRIGIFRVPSSRVLHAGWRDASGAYHRESTGCRDPGAARLWLAAKEVERVKEQAGLPSARHVSLNVATAEYVAQHEASWSKNYRDTVEGAIRGQVLPWFSADRLVSSITRADVEAFRAAQQVREIRGGKTVSPATVNRLLAALAAFGSWCLVEGRAYHITNPWSGHKPLEEDDVQVPELEEAQVQRLLVALEGPKGALPQHGARRFRYPWRDLLEFARETGLRRGELSRLAWSHINERTRTLALPSQRRKGGRNKGGKLRLVPLSPRALEILQTRSRPEQGDGLVWGRIPDGRRAFATAARAAGLERVWTHLARHLFASRLAERGAGRHELREAGGWSSSRMPDRYLHARMSRLRQLIDGPPGTAGAQSAPETTQGVPAGTGTP